MKATPQVRSLEERVNLLRTVEIFSETGEELLREIALKLSRFLAAADEKIFAKGDPGDAMFIIVEGKVKVHNEDYTLVEMHAGQVFGEYSLVEKVNRSASVSALEPSEFLRLDQADFYDLIGNHPAVNKGVMKALIKQMLKKNELEEELSRSNEQIRKQKEEIELQREKTLESIRYARSIQESLLLSEEEVQQYFPESFLLFRPRDIVSGDFYWVTEKDDLLLVAAVDCTGHGVPGAFMSMIGKTLLDEIVFTKNITSPAIILEELHLLLLETLHQNKEDSAQDGMDLNLCVIDRSAGEIRFSGARNPLVIVRNGELEVIKADYHSVGGRSLRPGADPRLKFQEQTLVIEEGMYLFLFSDGFVDQFGGEEGKKFGQRPFYELLQGSQKRTVKGQKEKMEQALESWMGSQDQIDDILVIGIRM